MSELAGRAEASNILEGGPGHLTRSCVLIVAGVNICRIVGPREIHVVTGSGNRGIGVHS